MGYKCGDCVHWPAVEACLTSGPSTIQWLAVGMYGADNPDNRQAAALVMMRMARQGRVVRLKAGWYALPDKPGGWPPFSLEALAAYITEKGRTAWEIGRHFNITNQYALRAVKRLGVKLEVRRASPARWSRFNTPCSTFKIRRARRDWSTTRPSKVVTRPASGFYRCSHCEEVKPKTIEYFYFRRDGTTTGYCRPCQKAWARSTYRKKKAA